MGLGGHISDGGKQQNSPRSFSTPRGRRYWASTGRGSQECVAPLTEEQVWWRPNDASNSIGNLLLHLNGNVGQWLVASFNKDEDKRDRPAEFAAQSGLTAAELLARLGATLDEAGKVLARLTVDDLLAPCEIQGYHMHGLDAVYHVVEHFGHALRPDPLYRKEPDRKGSWVLQGAEQNRPR